MKRSQLVQLIREELSKIPANQNINNNLMRIVNREKPELNIAKDKQIKYQGDPAKGENIIITKGNVKNGENILKQADQKNLERILRGEKPIYEDKHQTYSKNQVIKYLSELDPNTEVKIPDILPGGFSSDVGWRTTAQKAIQALKQAKSDGEFELTQDSPTYKGFSLVQTPQQLQAREKLVRGMGPLD